MDMSPQEYQQYVKGKAKPSPLGKNLCFAFVIGGGICVLGQLLMGIFARLGLEEEMVGTATSVSLVLLSAVLTGLNLYHRLARYGGAGTLVPITGFANAVVSPAMEFKSEGLITGTGAKIFTIAGPVIAYGILASVAYGLLYWLLTL